MVLIMNLNLLCAPVLPPHTECQQPKATETSQQPSFTQAACTNLGASASWVGQRRGGYEGAAQAGRVSGYFFTTVPSALAGRSPTPAVRHPCLGDTQEPSLPQGEPRVVGAGTWETEEGPCGWNSPNQLPLPSPQGAVSRWGVLDNLSP